MESQKSGLNQSGSQERCVPRLWQDTEETLGWDLVLTPKGSGRQGWSYIPEVTGGRAVSVTQKEGLTEGLG